MRSHTGYVMTLGGCPVHWASKLQTEIALSTGESEYIALAQALQELIPMCRLLDFFKGSFNLSEGDSVIVKSKIFEDNNGAISMASTPQMTPCTKHIAVKYHFVKRYFGDNKFPDHPFFLEKIDTKEQKADIFTKGLPADTFQYLCSLLCNY